MQMDRYEKLIFRIPRTSKQKKIARPRSGVSDPEHLFMNLSTYPLINLAPCTYKHVHVAYNFSYKLLGGVPPPWLRPLAAPPIVITASWSLQKSIKNPIIFNVNFWYSFGTIFAPIWAPSGAQNRSKIDPKWPSRLYLHQKHWCSRNLTKTNEFWWFLTSRLVPKRSQTGPKTAPKRCFFHLRFMHRFGTHFGTALASFWHPFGPPKS